jgi:tetratricopeptide (TPR) repeat protein
MGRAFSEVISRDLVLAPRIYALTFERVHSRDAALGARPVGAPGISAEFTPALAAGANRLGYGQYFLRGGKLHATLTIEDASTQKMVRVLSASSPSGNPIEAADSLARQLASQADAYPTHNSAAVAAYVGAIEAPDLSARAARLEEAISADPGFPTPYYLLAQMQKDRTAALSLVDRALQNGSRLPELERVRLTFLAANLHADRAAAQRALGDWARLTPNDPEVWRSTAQDAMLHHDYARAVEGFQKSLAVEPDDVSALNSLGYAAAYAGQLDTSMSALQHYQAVRPADANPLDSMGDVNLLLGRLREAEDFYLQAFKKDPAFMNAGDLSKAAMARLMSGDISGGDGLEKQFLDARRAAKDPAAAFVEAEWWWTSGRRVQARSAMTAFARATEATAPPLASQAYGELAIWSLALGDRDAAAQSAQRAVALATPASAVLAAIARFLTQPSAPASEWQLRAEHAFPLPAQEPVRSLMLTYALLTDKRFPEAAALLRTRYEHPAATNEEDLPWLLAWADLESGQPKEAASLLRFNPIPPSTGIRPLGLFEFPRLFYLRGRSAALAGNSQQAQSYYGLFLKLSGDLPLMWGEESRAKQR